jgi:hypothetical protein
MARMLHPAMLYPPAFILLLILLLLSSCLSSCSILAILYPAAAFRPAGPTAARECGRAGASAAVGSALPLERRARRVGWGCRVPAR